MLIVGAKGFAKEVLEILYQNEQTKDLCFFDNTSENFPNKLYNEFKVIKLESDVLEYFKNQSKYFTLGLGNPKLRHKLFEKFRCLGGELVSTISNKVDIGSFGVEINSGCNILSGVKISNDVKIGFGTIIYYNSVITHDVEVGDFVEISPNVTLLGRCKVGSFSQIGSGAIVFPDVKIGKNTIVGAGAVVRKDLPDNCIAVGVPARIIK